MPNRLMKVTLRWSTLSLLGKVLSQSWGMVWAFASIGRRMEAAPAVARLAAVSLRTSRRAGGAIAVGFGMSEPLTLRGMAQALVLEPRKVRTVAPSRMPAPARKAAA